MTTIKFLMQKKKKKVSRFLGGLNVTTRPVLADLNVEKWVMSQEMQQPVETRKGWKTDFPPEPLERNAALPMP